MDWGDPGRKIVCGYVRTAVNFKICFSRSPPALRELFPALSSYGVPADDFDKLNLLSSEARQKLNVKDEFGDRLAKRISHLANNLKAVRDKLFDNGIFATRI